jgi:hypothetical protein
MTIRRNRTHVQTEGGGLAIGDGATASGVGGQVVHVSVGNLQAGTVNGSAPDAASVTTTKSRHELRAKLLGVILGVLGIIAAVVEFVPWKIPAPAPFELTEPRNGQVVDVRTEIRGTAPDSDAHVVVVVRAVKETRFWAQPVVAVASDGSWSVTAYLGEEGTPPGTQFAIRAFRNPAVLPAAGEIQDWPQAEAISNEVRVERR